MRRARVRALSFAALTQRNTGIFLPFARSFRPPQTNLKPFGNTLAGLL